MADFGVLNGSERIHLPSTARRCAADRARSFSIVPIEKEIGRNTNEKLKAKG
jgi:hypothetical protein